MTQQVFAILAALVLLVILPDVMLIEAYAKYPIHNGEHTLGQFTMLLFVPLGAAIVVLGVWALRARHQPIATK